MENVGNKRLRPIVFFLIKIAIAFGIVSWIIGKGKLDFGLFAQFFQDRAGDWIIALILLAVVVFLCSYRWKTILDIKAEVPYGRVVGNVWIGLLFSPLLPGMVSGDVVRIAYGRTLDKKLSFDYLISSVLMDRIFGLMGLALISGIVSLTLGDRWEGLSWGIKQLILFNISILTLFLVFVFLFLSKKKGQECVGNKLGMIPFIGAFTAKVFAQFCMIGKRRRVVFSCLFVSVIAQSIEIFVFWFLSHSNIAGRPELLDVAILFPVGMIAVSIPITPLGFGVGHLVFYELFALYGIREGANYFNAFILTHLVNGFWGLFPYLFGRSKVLGRRRF
ncbi:MAG: lysylphosphatidylglycerol synthase transmembrane domain-containing protein [Bacteriovoracales bacterium]|nr:lysylphosphatidylglycerol synthase transmembrane domain-containing protein [Bacteriovoracales bacterium]